MEPQNLTNDVENGGPLQPSGVSLGQAPDIQSETAPFTQSADPLDQSDELMRQADPLSGAEPTLSDAEPPTDGPASPQSASSFMNDQMSD